MIDWSDAEITKDVVTKCIGSMFATLITLSLIPLNYIALVAGLGVFLANTALFKAASVTIAPVLVQNLQKRVEEVAKLVSDARKSGKDAVVEAVVFENQRWWAGISWAPVLLGIVRTFNFYGRNESRGQMRLELSHY